MLHRSGAAPPPPSSPPSEDELHPQVLVPHWETAMVLIIF